MRVVRFVLFATLATIPTMMASEALAAAPSCFNSEMSTVNQAFFEAAPDGSAMEEEGEARLNQMANNGLSGGIVSGEMIKIAEKHGYRWDCSTESFVLATPPTTATSTTTTTFSPTTTTTIRPTTTSTSTTTTRPVDYAAINIVVPTYQATPLPTNPQVNTPGTIRPTAPPDSVAVAAATAPSDSSTTSSTTAPDVADHTDVVAAPASKQSDGASSGGSGGTVLLLLAIGIAAAFGIGGGVLIGRRRG